MDLNRQWVNPSKILHPTAYTIKQLLRQLEAEGQHVEYFIDLHGHSKK